ncbi:MAG: hypothetical protein K0R31_2414 [Clostridiales bacterium]|jgi:hypothetical protein|nr:hypothetical protein [Clostridiales bacterium]
MSKIGDLLDVYDTEDKKYVMKNASRIEIAEKFGITGKKVSYNLCHGYKLHGRYLFAESEEKSFEENFKNTPSKLEAKWNDVVKAAALLRTGKGKMVTERINGKLVKYVKEV